MTFKKILTGLLPIVLFFMSAIILTVYACGGFAGFALQGTTFETQHDTNVLLTFRNGHENLVFEPSYSGSATKFGLVVPFPNKPQIRNAPKELFGQLEDLTEPFTPPSGMPIMGTLGFAAANKSAPVVVIERKSVGDFTATVVTATSTEALLKWLKDNSFEYRERDAVNFDYYVKKTGYYFVALKVNVDKMEVDGTGMLARKLRPIGFSFSTSEPFLPMRITASDMGEMGFNLYTLSTVPYYVPGADISFSRPLTLEDVITTAPSLLVYDATWQWLVRHTIRTNPPDIQEDLTLTRGNDNLIVLNSDQEVKVKPQLLPVKSGIMQGTGNNLSIGEEYYAGTHPLPVLMLLRIILAVFAGAVIAVCIWFIRHRKIQIPIAAIKRLAIYILLGILSFPLVYLAAYIGDIILTAILGRDVMYTGGSGIVNIIAMASILIPNVVAAKIYRRRAALYVLCVQFTIILGFMFLLRSSYAIEIIEYIATLVAGG